VGSLRVGEYMVAILASTQVSQSGPGWLFRS
jgi:hypothetical protein